MIQLASSMGIMRETLGVDPRTVSPARHQSRLYNQSTRVGPISGIPSDSLQTGLFQEEQSEIDRPESAKSLIRSDSQSSASQTYNMGSRRRSISVGSKALVSQAEQSHKRTQRTPTGQLQRTPVFPGNTNRSIDPPDFEGVGPPNVPTNSRHVQDGKHSESQSVIKSIFPPGKNSWMLPKNFKFSKHAGANQPGIRTGSTFENTAQRESILNASYDSMIAQSGSFVRPYPERHSPLQENHHLKTPMKLNLHADQQTPLQGRVLSNSDLKLQIFKSRAKQSIERVQFDSDLLSSPRREHQVSSTPQNKDYNTPNSMNLSSLQKPGITSSRQAQNHTGLLQEGTSQSQPARRQLTAPFIKPRLQICSIAGLQRNPIVKPSSPNLVSSSLKQSNLTPTRETASIETVTMKPNLPQLPQAVEAPAQPAREAVVLHQSQAVLSESNFPQILIRTPEEPVNSAPVASKDLLSNSVVVEEAFPRRRHKISWSPDLEQVIEHPLDGESKISDNKLSQLEDGASNLDTNKRLEQHSRPEVGQDPNSLAEDKPRHLQLKMQQSLQKLRFVSRLKNHINNMINSLRNSKEGPMTKEFMERLAKSLGEWVKKPDGQHHSHGPTILSLGTISSLQNSEALFSKLKELAFNIQDSMDANDKANLKWSVNTDQAAPGQHSSHLTKKVSLKLMVDLHKLAESQQSASLTAESDGQISHVVESPKVKQGTQELNRKRKSHLSLMAGQSGFHEVFQIDLEFGDPFALSEPENSYLPSRQQLDPLERTLIQTSRGDVSIRRFNFLDEEDSLEELEEEKETLPQPRRASTSFIRP